jgi:hypothetical protein
MSNNGSNDDDLARSIKQKVEREKALINAANTMRQSTNNPAVLQGLDTKIRDGRKNIEYLEGRLREHQMKQLGNRMGDLGMGGQDGYGGQGGQYGQQGEYGDQQYSQLSGGNGMMPPAAPFARQTPGGPAGGAAGQRTRPNYSRLGKEFSSMPSRSSGWQTAR